MQIYIDKYITYTIINSMYRIVHNQNSIEQNSNKSIIYISIQKKKIVQLKKISKYSSLKMISKIL